MFEKQKGVHRVRLHALLLFFRETRGSAQDGQSHITRLLYDNETDVTDAYDALGRKVTREETLWAENQPQGKAWGLQKEPCDLRGADSGSARGAARIAPDIG